MPQLDTATFPSQLFWLFFSFGCLYLFMSKMILPRAEKLIQQRWQGTQGRIEEADRLTKAAEQFDRDLAHKESIARDKAQEIVRLANAEAAEKIHLQHQKIISRLQEDHVLAEKTLKEAQTALSADLRLKRQDLGNAVLGKVLDGLLSSQNFLPGQKEENRRV